MRLLITYSASFTRVKRFLLDNSTNTAYASSSSKSWISIHKFMSTASGIFLSSGNEPRSRKHSLTFLERKSTLAAIRSSSRVSCGSEMDSARVSRFFAPAHIFGELWPRIDAATTLRAKGSPLHSATTCGTNYCVREIKNLQEQLVFQL